MLEPMWIWGGLGLALLAAEIATGTMYILWFGIAALCIALITALAPGLSIGVQLAMFAILSIGSLAIWKINYKKTETHSKVGQAQGTEIGTTGTITEACNAQQNGKIVFAQGVMGSREWVAVSNEAIEVGQPAKVIAVEGNSLRVSAQLN